MDAKVVKRFILGNVQASAEISVQNLLNHDDLTLAAYRTSSINGVALQQGPQGPEAFWPVLGAGSLHELLGSPRIAL